MVMHPRTRRYRVGLIVTVSTVLFLGLLVFIVGNSLTTKTVQYFVIYEDNVKGMVVGSRVNFQGIPVGQVSDMRFQSGKTLVTLEVDPDKAVIQEHTKARMDRLLVTGQVSIELEGYQPGSREKKPGSVIDALPDPMTNFAQSLPEVVESASGVIHEGHLALKNINQLIGPETQGKFQKILGDVERTTAQLPDGFATLVSRADRTLLEAEGAVAALRKVAEGLGSGDGDVRTLVGDARRAIQSIIGIRTELDATLGEVRSLLAMGNATVQRLRRPLMATLVDFQGALDEVAALARVIKLAPNSLVFGRDDNEIKVPGAAPLK